MFMRAETYHHEAARLRACAAVRQRESRGSEADSAAIVTGAKRRRAASQRDMRCSYTIAVVV